MKKVVLSLMVCLSLFSCTNNEGDHKDAEAGKEAKAKGSQYFGEKITADGAVPTDSLKSMMGDDTLLNCKLIGIDFTDCSDFLFAVQFDKCVLDYSFFLKKNLKKTFFLDCSIREANFSESNLTDARFQGCDLHQTVFERTNLHSVDFRTASNYSINPEANNIRKARFSYPAVLGLLDKYGIIVV